MHKYFVLMVCFLVVFLVGCRDTVSSHTPKKGELCFGVDDSLICKATKGDPLKLDALLLGVNMAALSKDVYAKKEAIKVIDYILNFIGEGDNVTYLMVIKEATKKIKNSSALVLVASPYISKLSRPVAISSYDIKLIKAHLKKQKALIETFSGE